MYRTTHFDEAGVFTETWLSLWTPPGKELGLEQPWGRAVKPGTQEGVPVTEAPPTPERRSRSRRLHPLAAFSC